MNNYKKLDGSKKTNKHHYFLAELRKSRHLIGAAEKMRFYNSHHWKILKIWASQTFKKECFCCGSTLEIHLDHIEPISISPRRCLYYRNVQFLCKVCNLRKSNKSHFRFKANYIVDTRKVDRAISDLRYHWVEYFPTIRCDGQINRTSASSIIKNVEKIKANKRQAVL